MAEDLTTLAGLQAYRTILQAAIQDMSLAAGEFTIEGFEYDRSEAYKNLKRELTSIELQIAAKENSSTKEPQRLGIDTGDLSDDI